MYDSILSTSLRESHFAWAGPGGDGSVRCISKHPDGLPIVATVGLDRVARVFHVPTGRQLQQMFLNLLQGTGQGGGQVGYGMQVLYGHGWVPLSEAGW